MDILLVILWSHCQPGSQWFNCRTARTVFRTGRWQLRDRVLGGWALKNNPFAGLDRPWGFQEIESSRFPGSRRMKVVRLSSLRTSCLYPPGCIPGTRFC